MWNSSITLHRFPNSGGGVNFNYVLPWFKSERQTLAPACSSLMAKAFPRPWAEPVMTQTFPRTSMASETSMLSRIFQTVALLRLNRHSANERAAPNLNYCMFNDRWLRCVRATLSTLWNNTYKAIRSFNAVEAANSFSSKVTSKTWYEAKM